MSPTTKVLISTAAGMLLLAGCTTQQRPANARVEPSSGLAAHSAQRPCEVLGELSARADCNCFDRMSYNRVRGEATENLRREALQQFPDTDRVDVSDVDLFLNNAVAHGIAYRCTKRT